MYGFDGRGQFLSIVTITSTRAIIISAAITKPIVLSTFPMAVQGNRTIKPYRIEPAHDNQDFEKP